MPGKFQNKFRIPSTRLINWNYGWNTAYFVTICTHNRENHFGDILKPTVTESSKIQLSKIGHLAEKYWQEIPEHFPFVVLDDFIVMPNHVHGIIIIDKKDDGRDMVETQDVASLQPKNKFGPQSQNLPSIIRGYKIGVTKNARKINPTFAWQTRYYDHIIRNDKSLQKIKNYICQNPLNWHNGDFYMKIKT